MTLPLKKLNLPNIKRFGTGAAVGLIISTIQWGCYIYFYGESIPLVRGIAFCLVISIICGWLTLKWGYETVEKLLQLLE